MEEQRRIVAFRKKKGKTIPITDPKVKRACSQVQASKLFKPITPKGTWTPAYREIRRTKDVINSLFEKLPPRQQAKLTVDFAEALQSKHGSLAKRRVEAQRELLAKLIRMRGTKCYFCHKPVKATEDLTTHHINKIHEDNHPCNKAICHETCHRKFHYRDVKPRND